MINVKKHKTSIWLIALLFVLSLIFAVAPLTAKVAYAAEGDAQISGIAPSSFIDSDSLHGVTLTENQAVQGTDSAVTLDGGRKGLLLRATQTGKDAIGSSFAFANEMAGTFTLDFRVFSQKTWAGERSTGTWGDDNFNPWLDLKEIGVKFTDAVSGKSFTVMVNGGVLWSNQSTMMSVKTGEMSKGVAWKYPDYSYDQTPKIDSTGGYKTILYGTSFSNYGVSKYSAAYTMDADGGCSSVLEFDPTTMKVYGYAKNTSYEQVKVEVADLTNTDMFSSYAHDLSGFTKYTVEIEFTDVTANDNEATGSAYERTAQMLIYSLNGVLLDSSNGGITKTTLAKPVIVTEAKEAFINEELDVTPLVYDPVDGYIPYVGAVSYSTASNPTPVSVTADANGRYYIALDSYEDVTVFYDGVTPSVGIAGEPASITFKVEDKSAPILVFAEGVKASEALDFDNKKPVIDVSDVIASTEQDFKTITTCVKYVETPSGKKFENYLNPFAEEGTYKVYYSAIDNFGNETILIREIKRGNLKPTITAESELTGTLNKGINLAPTATSWDGKALTVDVKIYKDGVLFSDKTSFKPPFVGEYKVVYTAVDEDGNTAEKEVALTVSEISSDTSSENSSASSGGCSGTIATQSAVLIFAVLLPMAFVISRRKNSNQEGK